MRTCWTLHTPATVPAVPGFSLLRRQPREGSGTDTEKLTRERPGEGSEKELILCRLCGTRITTPSRRIGISGSHEHTFQNPAGFMFHIGCFSAAEGCILYGTPTFEHTWFPQYSWVFAFCGECISHLGWYFQSSSDGFFGLILDKLVTWTAPDAQP